MSWKNSGSSNIMFDIERCFKEDDVSGFTEEQEVPPTSLTTAEVKTLQSCAFHFELLSGISVQTDIFRGGDEDQFRR